MTWASSLGVRKKFGGPKRAWYVLREFTYKMKGWKDERTHQEFFCPNDRKWKPSLIVTYPASQGVANSLAFEVVSKDLELVGQVRVVCRRVPLQMRYVVSG